MKLRKFDIGSWHDKYYKFLLLIPLTLILLSLFSLGVFYSQHGDFMYKDISLTGGTSVTLQGSFDAEALQKELSPMLEDLVVREVYDLVTKEKKAIILETTLDINRTKTVLEDYFGHPLTEENSSFEYTGSSLGKSFFKQLILAVIYAFTFMGLVVFFLFAKQRKVKFFLTLCAILPPLLFFVFKVLTLNQAILFSLVVLFFTIGVYLKYNIPSFAVIISAFADILMTLALVDFLGIKMSSAGIIAFLMLIGYSVDTDILLTNRVLRGEGSLNERLFSSFKTGMTMTATSFVAFLVALLVVSSFSDILSKIFTILVIGLGFDVINTWITNVGLLKWYFGRKNEN